MPWYNGNDILTYLENINVEDTENEKGFYVPVQRVSRPDHTFRGFQGQVEAGIVEVGDEITVLPSKEKASVKSINVDKKRAVKGQSVTIELDREVDVSRGSVLTKDTNLIASDLFVAKILWMDDEILSKNKEFLIKLGTKQILAKIASIKYKIDVNTGKHEPAGSLKKNEIAVCSIQLDEEIIISEFKKYKTLGEFILIDRISNMTSACGVVEKVFSNKNNVEEFVFEYEDFKARGEIFEEYYYDADTLEIYRYLPEHKKYTIGDEISVKGESYEYPDDFDLLVFRDNVYVKVRNKIIVDINSIKKYTYSNSLLINGRGFAINVDSSKEFSELLKDYKELNNADFLNKWVEFLKYRKIVFHN